MNDSNTLPTARRGAIATPPTLQLGELEIVFLDGGGLWLDGGTMFGIIPKPLWSRLVSVDPTNRIPLATTCFLIRTGGKTILIETGCGQVEKYEEKERGFFGFGDCWIVPSLTAAGVDPGEIDIVILTHLHFDHAGGGTMADGRGGYRPTFPRAKYVVQRGEWEDAVSGHAVMSGTYRRENLAPLETAGVLSLMEGEAEIAPGVRVRLFPGHTRHQQGVVFTSAGKSAVLPADLMPTSAHVGLRYNMAYDLMPYENMMNKRHLLESCAANGCYLLLGQDPREPVWRVERIAADRFSVQAQPAAVR